MLVNWTVENFKSIGSKLTLSLSPITVLVGANSAGKSSIIQSILLIKQTLQYATPDRAIALNGPLLKLGNFNDVKNVISQERGFLIGWKYDPASMSSALPYPVESPHLSRASYSPSSRNIAVVECHTRFDVDETAGISELQLLQPHLASCEISARGAEEYEDEEEEETRREANLSIRRTDAPMDEALARRMGAVGDSSQSAAKGSYVVQNLDGATKREILAGHPAGEIVGAILRHFFPYFIGVKFDDALRRANRIADLICGMRNIAPRVRSDYVNLTAPPKVIAIIENWLAANATFFGNQQQFLFDVSDAASLNTITDVLDKLQLLRRRHVHRPSSFPSMQDLQPQLADALAETFVSRVEVDLERPRLIADGMIQSREYFDTYVRYLGPLRDEPKPLYPLEALANPTDVGYRGEHTAAVLHLNRYRSITYLPSENFKDTPTDASIDTERRTGWLVSAVEDWLSYMGVVEGVSTGDRGKIGHELKVKTPGIRKDHDLTNVGVGVSQVLPIVLMALLAPPGSFLIFEQPELHLHPRVQTRLADFFISIALSGKQCLLETHSEYLIHRLRRRIAEAPGDKLTHLSKLYFVEREGGLTRCRPVDITRYGAILDWPADFFDQAQIEAERILAAAAVKRSSEKKANRKKADETRFGPLTPRCLLSPRSQQTKITPRRSLSCS